MIHTLTECKILEGFGRYCVPVLAAFCIVVIVAADSPAQQPDDKSQATEVDVINSGSLYSVEFREKCGPPWLQSTLGTKLLVALRKAGITIKLGGTPPLVSQENLEYSLVATQGETDLRTGRIFAEVGPGSELTFKNTEGKAVVLQIDITKVCWDVDFDGILEEAEMAGSDHAIVVAFSVEDLTSDVNIGGSLGKQKSFRVNADMFVLSASTGNVIDAFSGEKRTMDVSAEAAISASAEYLSTKIVEALEISRKTGILSW